MPVRTYMHIKFFSCNTYIPHVPNITCKIYIVYFNDTNTYNLHPYFLPQQPGPGVVKHIHTWGLL